MVKRYGSKQGPYSHYIGEVADGDYVLHSDYAKLEAEHAALRAKAYRMAEALEKWARVETGSGMWKDEAAAKQRAMQALADYRGKGKP